AGSLFVSLASGERITFLNTFNSFSGEINPNAIEFFYFSNGSTWNIDAMRQSISLLGTEVNDTLYGVNTDDLLEGGAGNDILYGLHGNDTLIGGAGNDTLRGGFGSDVYIFNRGDGA